MPMSQRIFTFCLCATFVACIHDFSFIDHLPFDDVVDADVTESMSTVDVGDSASDADEWIDGTDVPDDADVHDAEDVQDADDVVGDISDVLLDLVSDLMSETRDSMMSDTTDTTTDAGFDARMDAATDVSADVRTDRGFDVPDVQQDVSADLVRDVAMEERTADAGTDVAPDAIVMDTMADARADAAVEISSDAMPDVPVMDLPPSLVGCADETAEQVYQSNMVGCNGMETQCNAVVLCGRGWHLCTMSEYATRGGETTRPTSPRWIASCIRDNRGTPYCATNAVCPNCTAMGATRANSDWSCTSTRVDDTGAGNAGVLASPSVNTDAPHRLGCPASPCIWGVNGAVWSLFGAVCCR